MCLDLKSCCVCVCVCEGGGDTEDKRAFELQIITRNETISDQKAS